MRILFVHQNFPGQFGNVAAALSARGHEVRVLTAAGNERAIAHATIRYQFAYKERTSREIGISAGNAGRLERGFAAARAAAEIRDRHGFVPDVIVGNPGWGETLYLKQVWPSARLMVYAEFYYRPHGLDTNFDPELQKPSLSNDIWISTRQMPLLKAIEDADHAVAPTRWQASTFPAAYHDRIAVVHDGVDTDSIAPDPAASVTLPGTDVTLRAGDEVLTFVNRNLEPYRGYHVLMRALPEVLAARPRAQVVLVGGDQVSYGLPPSGGNGWKQVFLDEVKGRLDLSRVHFTGRVPYPVFLDLMRVARAHAYLSYPFVLSWSMLEAMAAGALIVGSRTPPIAEVIEDGVNGRLVDFFDVAGWSRTLIEVLAAPQRFAPLAAAGRETVRSRYDLKRICLPAMVDLIENGPAVRA